MQVSNEYIQWKYSGDSECTNLVSLSRFNGIDGKEVTFQVADGYIQWHYTGETEWINLIELSTLKGLKGENGLSAFEFYKLYHPEYIGSTKYIR